MALALTMAGCTGQPNGVGRANPPAMPTETRPAPSATVSEAATVESATPTSRPWSPAPTGWVGTPEDYPGGRLPRDVTVPILLYHHISADTPPVRYTIASQRFEAQLDYLADHGYETITVQDLSNAVRAGVALPRQPVVLTFDDGNQDLFELAFPSMRARGMVGVVYVVGNRIGAEGFLSAESLRVLRGAGWEIGSHGMSHRALADLNEKDLAAEVGESRSVIEAALGEPIRSFAYPFGTVTEAGLLAVIDAGYTSGAGLGLWNVHRPDSLFYLSRREVHGTFELEEFSALLRTD